VGNSGELFTYSLASPLPVGLKRATLDDSETSIKGAKDVFKHVIIPVGAPLKAMLAATPRRSEFILLNSDGRPWTEDGFRSSWAKGCKKAGIGKAIAKATGNLDADRTFHDLRGTAVTRLAVVGCTEAEISYLTGLNLSDVRSILDAHYLHRDPALGESAIRKLESRTDVSNYASNWSKSADAEMTKK
jgi:integrase